MKNSLSEILMLLCVLLFVACSGNTSNVDPADEEKELNVLIFSKTGGYRHASIEPGGTEMKSYFDVHGISSTLSEDSSLFNSNGLEPFDVVMFFNTTGNILDSLQQLSLIAHVKSGKGFVGIHSAADTEYDWPWFGELIGVRFKNHPDIQQATFVKTDTSKFTKHLPDRWMRTDEIYNFDTIPNKANVVLEVDETTYNGGTHGEHHPISWYNEFDGGRVFYTAMGHTTESYSDTLFLRHLLEAVKWASRRE